MVPLDSVLPDGAGTEERPAGSPPARPVFDLSMVASRGFSTTCAAAYHIEGAHMRHTHTFQGGAEGMRFPAKVFTHTHTQNTTRWHGLTQPAEFADDARLTLNTTAGEIYLAENVYQRFQFPRPTATNID